jgi:hypothetical protein
MPSPRPRPRPSVDACLFLERGLEPESAALCLISKKLLFEWQRLQSAP